MAPTSIDEVLTRNNVLVSGNADGRAMIFAHGFGCSLESWRLIAPEFEEDHQVVLFDHVGSGNSDIAAYDRGKYDSLDGYAQDVLEILEALDLHDVIFVGHSVSCMIGVLAANRDPSRFGELILVGPSPRYVNDEAYLGGFERVDIEALLDTLDANYLGWSGTMAPVIMGNPDRPELGDGLTASFCSIDPAIARHFARVTFLSDNRNDLPEVSVPTLVIQSSDDVIAPLEVGHYVHRSIPRSRLTVLSTTGHVPILSGAAELVAEIRRHLA
ncbi:alpha/beta fold hydrolase [Microbacterium sp. DT81.1]|uniref:alpha/beta fold hydrolase n=1 Tax=Microbacterium sp. DT81.1 TaxID=3393413 RepID=UPI003CF17D65